MQPEEDTLKHLESRGKIYGEEKKKQQARTWLNSAGYGSKAESYDSYDKSRNGLFQPCLHKPAIPAYFFPTPGCFR